MTWDRWWLFAVTVFLIAGTPGPNMLHVMTRSVRFGFARSVWAMAGCLSAVLLALSASALGLGALLLAMPRLFDVVRYAGAAYLLWLGIKAWRGAGRVKGRPAAGDLCCWLTHVGIAVSATHMISALDPAYGTAVTPIHGYGPYGETVSYRRISGVGTEVAFTSTGTGTSTGTAAAGCAAAMLMMPVLLPCAALVHFRRRRDDHRGSQFVGDDQDVILRQLVDDQPQLLPVAPGGLSDVFQHLLVPRAPDDDDRGLPRRSLGNPCGCLECRDY